MNERKREREREREGQREGEIYDKREKRVTEMKVNIV